MFRKGFLSIIRRLVLHTQQQVYAIQVLLTACYRNHPDPAQEISASLCFLL